MNGLENAQHDLSDAQFSLETAIELLSSIDSDRGTREGELQAIIGHLQEIRVELASNFRRLQDVAEHLEP